MVFNRISVTIGVLALAIPFGSPVHGVQSTGVQPPLFEASVFADGFTAFAALPPISSAVVEHHRTTVNVRALFAGQGPAEIVLNLPGDQRLAVKDLANFRQAGGGGSDTPLTPTNPLSFVSGMDVSLLWDSADSARYRLQIGTASGLSNVFDGDVGNIIRFNTTLGLGNYFWRVYAINSAGVSSPASAEGSFSVTTTCGIPTPPRNLNAWVNGTHVLLNWEPPALGNVASYVVEAGSASGGINLYNAPVGPQTNVQAFVPFGSYFVRLRAQNGCGTSSTSNEAFFLAGVSGTPAAPQDLRLTLTSNLATAAWNLAPGAPAPEAFIVEAGSALGLADLGTAEVSGQFYSVTVPRPGPGIYYVRIKARNGLVIGPASTDVVLFVP